MDLLLNANIKRSCQVLNHCLYWVVAMKCLLLSVVLLYVRTINNSQQKWCLFSGRTCISYWVTTSPISSATLSPLHSGYNLYWIEAFPVTWRIRLSGNIIYNLQFFHLQCKMMHVYLLQINYNITKNYSSCITDKA